MGILLRATWGARVQSHGKETNSLHRSHFAAIENLKSRAASGIMCCHAIIVKLNLQGLVSWPSSDRQARALVSRGPVRYGPPTLTTFISYWPSVPLAEWLSM